VVEDIACKQRMNLEYLKPFREYEMKKKMNKSICQMQCKYIFDTYLIFKDTN